MVKIFADLNCPFCFAQHERLKQQDMLDEFEWCFVEHAPEIVTTSNTLAQLEQLKQEFKLVNLRVKELRILLPSFCVNTNYAILSLLSVTIKFPKLANTYRSALYDAYWRQMKDISNPLVIKSILEELGITDTDLEEDAEAVLEWHNQCWQHGGLDRRIPALLSESNRPLLGLQHIDNIKRFLAGRDIENSNNELVCLPEEKPVLALVNLDGFHHQLEREKVRYIAHKLDNVQQIMAQSWSQRLEGIIIYQPDQVSLSKAIYELRNEPEFNPHTPIIAVLETCSLEDERLLFNAGASDVVHLDNLNLNLLPRINAHIQRFQVVRQLQKHAYLDGLTGVLNKRMFEERIFDEWLLACRNKSSLSLLMIDIDFFKKYNDFYGHLSGDICIQKVAKCLTEVVTRPTDLVARFGGEEFVILLPNTDLSGAKKVAENVQSRLAEMAIPHEQSEIGQRVTVSIGVAATAPHADRTSEEFVEFTDQKLYMAKQQGRNQSVAEYMSPPDYA